MPFGFRLLRAVNPVIPAKVGDSTLPATPCRTAFRQGGLRCPETVQADQGLAATAWTDAAAALTALASLCFPPIY
jgi:hypothetical protein